MINILIVDDHQVVGEGTKEMLTSEPQFHVKLALKSDEAVRLAEENRYDIYLLDLNMPDKNGIELTNEILQKDPGASILIFTAHNIATYFNYLVDAGVTGFISKTYSKQQLIRCVWCAIDNLVVIPAELLTQLRKPKNEVLLDSGQTITLDQMEEDILVLVSKGMTNEEIAEKLYMSRRNVERYLTKIFSEMGVKSRAEAILRGKELELIPEVI
ncbi:response regulator transcription factor [Gracilibacillus lacisalsi]|uniref:response regulator transcription factor n=1 Tax=Gracilibacillus lacisalsi TaxID=393087 RepID=UPI000368B3D4|nr:response regulator transcription factor [Gracilibacillus lacisalsi]